MAYTVCKVDQLKNMLQLANFLETVARNVKLGSYDTAWEIGYNSTTFVSILQILIDVMP